MGRMSVGNAGAILLASTSGSLTTGPLMLEAARYTKWEWYLAGTFTGFSVLVQGTADKATAGFIGQMSAPVGANWFNIVAQSEQVGTGTVVNPLTAGLQSLSYDRALLACRLVITATASTGTCQVYGFATK
jgi:hypothetical protein